MQEAGEPCLRRGVHPCGRIDDAEQVRMEIVEVPAVTCGKQPAADIGRRQIVTRRL